MLPAEPKAEADNTYRDLDYLGYHKNRANLIIVLLLLHCFEENNDKHTVARNLNGYSYWKSCIARATYRLVNYLPADT